MFNEELADFLAHSLELESEARERYQEMAEAMESHHNTEVAAFFRRMAEEASHHLAEVEAMIGSAQLPQMKPWEFRWLEAEAPESGSHEGLHYRMGLRQAVELALGNERSAERYYRHRADNSSDSETVRIASEFADEELQHVAALQQMLQQLPPDPVYGREEDDDPHLPE